MQAIYTILHTVSSNSWGLMEETIFHESAWMKDKGHRVIIVSPEKSPLYDKAREHGIIVYPMEFSRLNRFRDQKKLEKIYSEESPFIVNAHDPKDAAISLEFAQKNDIPCRIFTCHSPSPFHVPFFTRKLYKKRVHYVFTSSHSTRQHLMDTLDLRPTKIIAIQGGISCPDTRGQEIMRIYRLRQIHFEKELRTVNLHRLN